MENNTEKTVVYVGLCKEVCLHLFVVPQKRVG